MKLFTPSEVEQASREERDRAIRETTEALKTSSEARTSLQRVAKNSDEVKQMIEEDLRAYIGQAAEMKLALINEVNSLKKEKASLVEQITSLRTAIDELEQLSK